MRRHSPFAPYRRHARPCQFRGRRLGTTDPRGARRLRPSRHTADMRTLAGFTKESREYCMHRPCPSRRTADTPRSHLRRFHGGMPGTTDPRDTVCYSLFASYSRHAAQPPSPVSRRKAESRRPTQRNPLVIFRIVQPTRRAAALAGFAEGGRGLPTHATQSVSYPSRRTADTTHSRPRRFRRGMPGTADPRDAVCYSLFASYSQRATQPPSLVSRRGAGNCRSARRNPLVILRVVQPPRRAAALTGFTEGGRELSTHAAHGVDHLIGGHDQPNA